MKIVQMLEEIKVEKPCEVCGSHYFMVDGDGDKHWLLCVGSNKPRDCINTRPFPKDSKVVECSGYAV